MKERSMRQVIIARKDLNMSAGKLAAQCCHASTLFLIRALQKGARTRTEDTVGIYAEFPTGVFDEWIDGPFVKTVCRAKNLNDLMKAVKLAEELGLKEDEDFFLVKDACLTELEPEEIDENGIGRTLTCIGFRPLPDELAHQISKKYQLFQYPVDTSVK